MQITNVLEYLENTVKRVPDKTAYANENMEKLNEIENREDGIND